MRECPFCQQQVPLEQTNKVAGFDVCDQCYYGDLPHRLELSRGWTHQIKQWDRQIDDIVIHYTEIILEIPGGFPLTFKSQRRTWWHKIFGFLFRGIQARDPLFNNMVYISSDEPHKVQGWLADDRAQSVLMDLLGDFHLIRASRECIYGKHRSEDYTAPQRLFVEIAALGHSLDLFSKESL